MTKTTDTPETPVAEATVSTQRKVTAAVASTAVGVVIGLAANLVAGYAAGRVHSMIIPQTPSTTE